MADYTSPFLGRVAKRVPLIAEKLWELHRDGHSVRGGLIYHSDPTGFEFQEYASGHFIQGRRFTTIELAVAFGDKVRAEYARDGWT
jgi:hypothetical protein